MKRVLKYLISILLLIGLFIFIHSEVLGNFHKIDDNAYRSGKLNSLNLPYYIDEYEIKTIINVHGPSSKDWYQKEKEYSKEMGVNHIDFKMNSGKFYNHEKLTNLVDIMKNAEKPILIHCLGGADRTGLASALYEYAINEKSVDDSKKQLSWKYGHIPSLRPHVIQMDKSFDNFVEKEYLLNNKD